MGAKASKKSHHQLEVSDYRYKEKRRNNPDAGLATYNFKEIKKVTYQYDPHLDPQLVWSGKAEGTSFEVDTVSLHIHERVSAQAVLKSVQKRGPWQQLRLFAEPELPLNERIEFYQHEMDWANRLVLGDSLLVMNSLRQRELMDGGIQVIYMDPPYGINYSSNFQSRIGKLDVTEKDEDLTREPEQIKAYRDTWTLGVHSYLTYLRDRLLLCRELLHESGSIFVQISQENAHRVRNILDEIFGADNCVSVIPFRKKLMPLGAKTLESMCDYLLWYAKDRERIKYHTLYLDFVPKTSARWTGIELPDGKRRHLTGSESNNPSSLPKGSRVYRTVSLWAPSFSSANVFNFEFEGKDFSPGPGQCWITSKEKLEELAVQRRLEREGDSVRYILYYDDFPYIKLTNMWSDTVGAFDKTYVVETNTKVLERCILMTTDPGDLVFDPTCGSGTTAYVAEQWGRRWITCDTSRIAIALARQRLLTATFPFYQLARPDRGISGGLVYEIVSHITMKNLLENERKEEILYDRPKMDKGTVRVSGPFTVEAIPIASSRIEPDGRQQDNQTRSAGVATDYIQDVIELLRKNGVIFPGGKKLMVENLRPLSSSGYVHAEGETNRNGKSIRVAISIGPRYGPVTVKQVDESLRSAYRMGFEMMVFAGFAFDSEALATIQKNPIPNLAIQFANISPDIIVGDLLKAPRGSQFFTVFGEPDIIIQRRGPDYVVTLAGVDIYDPITGEVHQSTAKDIPAWFLDQDYDSLTFRISQAFFPREATKKNPWDRLENALGGNIDLERMEALRGLTSLPFPPPKEGKIAVKVVDVRGNEVMVVNDVVEEARAN